VSNRSVGSRSIVRSVPSPATPKNTGAKNAVIADHAVRERSRVDDAALRDAGDDRDDDPAQRVIDNRRRDDQLAKIAPHVVHLAHHHGYDLDRGDGKPSAEK
jgi:hypothetical protein